MKNLLILLSIIFAINIYSQDIWFKSITDEANDFLIMDTDSIFIMYGCEMGDFDWGLYEIKNDTIIFHISYNQYEKTDKSTIVAINKNDELLLLYRKWNDGRISKIKNYIMRKDSEDKLNRVEKWKLKLAEDELSKKNVRNIKF